jgi:hypothetical protein
MLETLLRFGLRYRQPPAVKGGPVAKIGRLDLVYQPPKAHKIVVTGQISSLFIESSHSGDPRCTLVNDYYP